MKINSYHYTHLIARIFTDGSLSQVSHLLSVETCHTALKECEWTSNNYINRIQTFHLQLPMLVSFLPSTSFPHGWVMCLVNECLVAVDSISSCHCVYVMARGIFPLKLELHHAVPLILLHHYNYAFKSCHLSKWSFEQLIYCKICLIHSGWFEHRSWKNFILFFSSGHIWSIFIIPAVARKKWTKSAEIM